MRTQVVGGRKGSVPSWVGATRVGAGGQERFEEGRRGEWWRRPLDGTDLVGTGGGSGGREGLR